MLIKALALRIFNAKPSDKSVHQRQAYIYLLFYVTVLGRKYIFLYTDVRKA